MGELLKTDNSVQLMQVNLELAALSDQEDSITVYFFDQAIENAKVSGSDSLQVSASLEKSRFYEQKGRYRQVHAALAGLEISEALPYKLRHRVFLSLGAANMHLGVLNEAFSFYEKAYRLAEENDDFDLQLAAHSGLANVHQSQFQYAEALKINFSLLADSAKLKVDQIAVICNSIGICYFHTGQYPKARKFWMKSAALLASSTDKNAIARLAYCYSNVSHTYKAAGDFDSALYFQKSALEIANELNNDYLSGAILLGLGNLEQGQGHFDKALEYFFKGEVLSLKNEVWDQQAMVVSNIAITYAEMGQHKNAYEYMLRYIDLEEKLYEEGKIEELANLKKDFEFQSERNAKAEELKRAALEIQKAKLQLEAETAQNQLLFVGLGALLVLILVGWYAFIRIQKSRKELAQRNVQLKTTVGEKELLVKEVHHRVRNNLQIISSLLALQSRKVKDEESIAIFEMGQSRVQAMALLHKKLYQGEIKAGVNLKEYLKDLIKEISSFNKEVKIEIDCPEIELDIDTAVPIGLVVNELVTNSFKYAYKDNLSPVLQVAVSDRTGGKYQLMVADNGQGIPAGFEIKKSDTLGMRLVHSLVKQLLGKVEYEYSNQMSRFIIQFNNEVARNSFN